MPDSYLEGNPSSVMMTQSESDSICYVQFWRKQSHRVFGLIQLSCSLSVLSRVKILISEVISNSSRLLQRNLQDLWLIYSIFSSRMIAKSTLRIDFPWQDQGSDQTNSILVILEIKFDPRYISPFSRTILISKSIIYVLYFNPRMIFVPPKLFSRQKVNFFRC